MIELYHSIVAAMIRFWDNRFVVPRCTSCETLATEIARLQDANSSLVDRLLGKVNQPAVPYDDADSKLETIHRAKRSWTQIKEELEAQHRRPFEKRNSDLADFEKALEELQ